MADENISPPSEESGPELALVFWPFLALLPELRNLIYEFAFTPSHTLSGVLLGKTELLESRPPPKALLQTSQQVYREAKYIYHESYRRYWQESHFCISSPPEDWIRITQFRDEDINQIEHLSLHVRGKSNRQSLSRTFELLQEKRVRHDGRLLRLGWKETWVLSEGVNKVYYGASARHIRDEEPGAGIRELRYFRQPLEWSLEHVLKWATPDKDSRKRQVIAIRRIFVLGDYATEDEWCLWTEATHVAGCRCYEKPGDREAAATIQAQLREARREVGGTD